MRAKLHASQGKQPRIQTKVPKYNLSVKGGVLPKTGRRLAQKQPSFKECVTAHYSTPLMGYGKMRLKFTGLKIVTEVVSSYI